MIRNLIWNSIRNLIIKFIRNWIWNKIWNSIRIQNLVKEVMHENFNQFFFYSDSIRHRNEISNFAHNLALFVYMYYILPVYLWFVFTFFKISQEISKLHITPVGINRKGFVNSNSWMFLLVNYCIEIRGGM